MSYGSTYNQTSKTTIIGGVIATVLFFGAIFGFIAYKSTHTAVPATKRGLSVKSGPFQGKDAGIGVIYTESGRQSKGMMDDVHLYNSYKVTTPFVLTKSSFQVRGGNAVTFDRIKVDVSTTFGDPKKDKKQDEQDIVDFDAKYGRRSPKGGDGKVYESDKSYERLIEAELIPAVQNALVRAMAQRTCSVLTPACNRLDQEAGLIDRSVTVDIAAVQAEVLNEVQKALDPTFGRFLKVTGINLNGARPAGKTQGRIDSAIQREADLVAVKTENRIKREKAQGEAQAVRIQARACRNNPRVCQLRTLEKIAEKGNVNVTPGVLGVK